MVFATILFVSSAANATWESHNDDSSNHCTIDCSNYKKLSNQYQKTADDYLQQYNSSHCYTYYHLYLCYAKKAAFFRKSFDSCRTKSTVSCNKYKIFADKYKYCATNYKAYADRYLDAYNNTNVPCLKRLYYKYYLCYKRKYDYFMGLYNRYMGEYNSCTAAQNPTGALSGKVFEDANNDGDFTDGEVGANGIEITITDSRNNTQHVISQDGTYVFNNVAEGQVSIVISSLPGGYRLIDGSQLSFSENIEASHNNIAQDTGYTLPEVIPLTCPANFVKLDMSVFTSGSNTSDNLQTQLDISIQFLSSRIIFKNAITSSDDNNNRPYQQFKIVAVTYGGMGMLSTRYTNDIDNSTNNDESTNLGSLELNPLIEKLMLVHRADPIYGDNISEENPVTFKGLCYKIVHF